MKHKWLDRTTRILARVAVTVVAVVVVLAAMLWLSGTFRSGKIEPAKLPPPPAGAIGAAATAKLVKLVPVAEPVGTVQAEHQTSITARIVANVMEMKVNAGDKVQQGQLLALLDDTPQKARVQQAKESLRAAQASRDYAAQEVERRRDLPPQVLPGSEREQWESKLNMATAEVARAEQAVLEAGSALSDTQIRSPINGVAIDRLVEPGDQSAPSKPLLTLYDPSQLRVEAAVRESDIGRLSPGQKLTVIIDSLKQEREGTVEQIVPAADPNSRTFLVKVHLPDPAKLFPGMYARLRIPLDETPTVQIPASAIRRVGQLTLVDVIRDGRSVRRAVRLGRSDGQSVEVLAGLAEGDQVALTGGT
jgi:RND family efflux transporter MFP subunit